MDNDKLILRTAALSLQATPSEEVVKIAGIVGELQHWLKKMTNPEYRAKVVKLDEDTKEVQIFMTQLNTELAKIRGAIRNGDVDKYQQSLQAARDLSLKFWSKIKEVSQEGSTVAKIMQGYTKEDMADPNFKKKFKSHLPADYDLDLDTKKRYSVPLKSVGWYSTLTPEMIVVSSSNTITIMAQLVIGKLKRLIGTESLDLTGSNLEILLSNIREAIVHGILISVSHRKHAPNMTQVEWGTTEIEVATAPFQVPGTDVTLNLIVTLIDPRTARTRTPEDKLVWVTSRAPKITHLPKNSLKTASQAPSLHKFSLSQETPLQYTSLSELQLAEVLRQGYKLAFGTDPTLQILAGGWAQAIFECGRPIKLPNNNIGNIKATSNWLSTGKSYFTKKTVEFDAEGKSYDLPKARWRAYASPQEGAAGYWKLLGNHYKPAMDWMAAGDPKSATVSMAKNHYFTANIESYAKGVDSLYREFITKIAPQLPNLQSVIATPPSPKLELKPWLKDYQTSPKNIQQTSTGKEPASDKEVDTLIQTLYSQVGSLEDFVKTAISRQQLPWTKFIILIQGDEIDITTKVKYATAINNILKKYLEISSFIHGDMQNIEIQGTTLGKPLTVTASLQAVCDCLSEALYVSCQDRLQAVVVPGFSSQYQPLETESIANYCRLFNLKKMGSHVVTI